MSALPTSRREFQFEQGGDGHLHVVEWGSVTPRLTLVLTHGLSLSSQSWEDVAELLVAADPTLRVIAYDHRGHGLSPGTSATLEILADDLAAVVDNLVPDGLIVFGGHSAGAMTLMSLAERHPRLLGDRVIGVAFVATSAGGLLAGLRRVPGSRAVIAVALKLSEHLKMPSRPLFLLRQATRNGLFGSQPRRHDMNRAVLQGAQANRRAIADLSRSILRHDRFDALQVFHGKDVVVMAGGRDALTSVEAARAIADHIPGSRLIVFDKAGHYLPYEHRDEIATHLLGLTVRKYVDDRGTVSVA